MYDKISNVVNKEYDLDSDEIILYIDCVLKTEENKDSYIDMLKSFLKDAYEEIEKKEQKRLYFFRKKDI